MEMKLIKWAEADSCYSETQFWGTGRGFFLNGVKPWSLEQLEAVCFLALPGTGSLWGRAVVRPRFSLSLGLSLSPREDKLGLPCVSQKADRREGDCCTQELGFISFLPCKEQQILEMGLRGNSY